MSLQIDPLEDEYSVLGWLAGARIVSFEQDGNVVVVTECCDNYFIERLNKEEFGRLIAELQEIHDRM